MTGRISRTRSQGHQRDAPKHESGHVAAGVPRFTSVSEGSKEKSCTRPVAGTRQPGQGEISARSRKPRPGTGFSREQLPGFREIPGSPQPALRRLRMPAKPINPPPNISNRACSGMGSPPPDSSFQANMLWALEPLFE